MFPPPWPTRPWIYANVIASRNGIVTWTRARADDDPVRVIARGDVTRPGRLADVRLMRQLRAGADAVSFGAQTLRDQPDLIGSVDDVGKELGAALIRFRADQGRGRVPLQVVYSESGRLDLAAPLFNTPGLTAIVVTTNAGERRLRRQRSDDRGVRILVAGEERVELVGRVLNVALELTATRLVLQGGERVLEVADAAVEIVDRRRCIRAHRTRWAGVGRTVVPSQERGVNS